MIEIWKDIKGYEGIYQVSNLGRVRSFLRGGRVLKPHSTGHYLGVVLYKENSHKAYLIHRLVANAFIENPNNFNEVNHKDENGVNNVWSNLEWCSHSENINYGNRNKKVGVRLGKPVLQINKNGNIVGRFCSIHEAGRNTGVDYRNIFKCCNGGCKSLGGYYWRYE